MPSTTTLPFGYRFTIPLPVSVNAAYLNLNLPTSGGKSRPGRVKTDKAKDWEKTCTPLLSQPKAPISEPCLVIYRYHFPKDGHTRDIANYEKVLSDLLKKRGVISDDSVIAALIQIKGESVSKGMQCVSGYLTPIGPHVQHLVDTANGALPPFDTFLRIGRYVCE